MIHKPNWNLSVTSCVIFHFKVTVFLLACGTRFNMPMYLFVTHKYETLCQWYKCWGSINMTETKQSLHPPSAQRRRAEWQHSIWFHVSYASTCRWPPRYSKNQKREWGRSGCPKLHPPTRRKPESEWSIVSCRSGVWLFGWQKKNSNFL